MAAEVAPDDLCQVGLGLFLFSCPLVVVLLGLPPRPGPKRKWAHFLPIASVDVGNLRRRCSRDLVFFVRGFQFQVRSLPFPDRYYPESRGPHRLGWTLQVMKGIVDVELADVHDDCQEALLWQCVLAIVVRRSGRPVVLLRWRTSGG